MKCPPLRIFWLLATECSFMATILQLKVAKRRLFEKVSLEHCIKFQFVSMHPRPYSGNTLLHSMYCLCLTKGVVWVEGKIKLSIVSKCMNVGQVQLDDFEQLAGIGT